MHGTDGKSRGSLTRKQCCHGVGSLHRRELLIEMRETRAGPVHGKRPQIVPEKMVPGGRFRLGCPKLRN